MITVNLTKKEVEYIMRYLKSSEHKELYAKFWRSIFNGGKNN
jgi:hypothetical protein